MFLFLKARSLSRFFSDKTQFILESNGNFQKQLYNCNYRASVDTNVQPVGAGNNVTLHIRVSEFTNVREYFVDEDNITKNAATLQLMQLIIFPTM